MRKLIITFLTSGFLCLGLGVALPSSATAANDPISTSRNQACQGAGLTGANCSSSNSNLNGIVNAAVQILSIIVGIVAVVMIVIAGFKYVTSAGDSGKIGSAKNTLIYALVGVFIVAIAQFLVHFVLTEATTCPHNNSLAVTDSRCVAPAANQ